MAGARRAMPYLDAPELLDHCSTSCDVAEREANQGDGDGHQVICRGAAHDLIDEYPVALGKGRRLFTERRPAAGRQSDSGQRGDDPRLPVSGRATYRTFAASDTVEITGPSD
jgi:hypothetical protein